jgi:hypothetical protein
VSQRNVAAHVSEQTCPRCGAARAGDQRYCVECGLRLPVVTGGLAAWRRGWVRRFGWYPGDWVWLTLLAGAVAAAGAAVAVREGRGHSAVVSAATTFVAPAPHLSPSTSARGPSGRTVWPRQLDGWTVVLVQSPAPNGRRGVAALAAHAARDGLPQVGVLDSSSFGTLHPGYYVVFSGVYGAAGDAQAALETVRARGFGGAYVTRIAP